MTLQFIARKQGNKTQNIIIEYSQSYQYLLRIKTRRLVQYLCSTNIRCSYN